MCIAYKAFPIRSYLRTAALMTSSAGAVAWRLLSPHHHSGVQLHSNCHGLWAVTIQAP